MAFDVYVGTFTRYYRRDWENVVQHQARLDGTPYKMIYAGGEPAPPPSVAEVQQAVDAWRAAINQGFRQHQAAELQWSEDNESYFTDRPGWGGYSGLLLWAAYAERPGKTPPLELPENWAEDETFLEVLSDDKNIHFRTILQANLWLPGEFRFCFGMENLVGEEVMIGSCSGLLDQLRELAAKPVSWSQSGQGQDRDTLENTARAGHERFLYLAEQAVQNHLPMMLSF